MREVTRDIYEQKASTVPLHRIPQISQGLLTHATPVIQLRRVPLSLAREKERFSFSIFVGSYRDDDDYRLHKRGG